MLDDIVYLGSNIPDDRPKERVTGVVLHIDRSGANEGYSMVYNREDASVVHIGRRSVQDKGHHSINSVSAMFRCAVVSRKHAKIVFADGGQAYIIDSGSHHGTHLRKAGESFSKMLAPETSTLLHDGDIITLGKAVGKGDEWVKPIVARVQLLYPTTPFKALAIPSPSSSPKSKSSSGRYGINDASSSEESYSSYSDIEEIPPPPPPTSQQWKCSDDPPQSVAQATPAYTAYKRIFSPAIRMLPSVSEIIGDRNMGFFDIAEKSQSILTSAICMHHDPHDPHICDFSLDSRSNSPMDLGSPSVPADVVVSRELSIPLPTSDLDILIRPTEAPLDVPGDPLMLGDSSGVCECPDDSNSLPPDTDPSHSAVVEPLVEIGIEHPAHPPAEKDVIPSDILQTVKKLETSVAKLHVSRRRYKSRFNANVSFISRKLSEIDDKFAEVDAEYNVLCDQVEGVQHGDLPDLTRQVEDLSDKVDTFSADKDDDDDDRIYKTELQSPVAMEDIKTSMKSLYDMVDEMRGLHHRTQEDISKDLLAMKAFREEAMEDIAQVKADIVAAAANAISTIVEFERAQVRTSSVVVCTNDFIEVVDQLPPPHPTPAPTSLKRKRDDTDEDEEAPVMQGERVRVVDLDGGALAGGIAAASTTSSVIQNEMTSEKNNPNMDIMVVEQVVDQSSNDGPSPRKKARRRIGSVIAQTATAVTIGAVVTWSALAFS